MQQRLSADQWARIVSLLPPQKPPVGRPAHDHRLVIDAILCHLATNAPWRSLPRRFGHWTTVQSRYRRWQALGIWDTIVEALG